MKGSITPRVRLQNEKKLSKNSENKENRGRNSSVGAFKRPIETKTITLVSKKIDPPPDNDNAVNVMATKYQDLLSKKDQIIDSMRKTIDNLNAQLVQAQTNVKQSNTQISELKGVYNEDITKMKFKIKRLEEKRGHSSNQRASNVSADNKDYRNEKSDKLYSDQNNEIIKLREQLAVQTKCYQQKYDTLAKEKELLLNNLRVSKRVLENEESNHKCAKERVKQLQVEIGSMKMAMGKLR
jgi:chromosome segregation ATPase